MSNPIWSTEKCPPTRSKGICSVYKLLGKHATIWMSKRTLALAIKSTTVAKYIVSFPSYLFSPHGILPSFTLPPPVNPEPWLEHLAKSGNPGQVKPLGEHLHGSTFMAYQWKGYIGACECNANHIGGPCAIRMETENIPKTNGWIPKMMVWNMYLNLKYGHFESLC